VAERTKKAPISITHPAAFEKDLEREGVGTQTSTDCGTYLEDAIHHPKRAFRLSRYGNVQIYPAGAQSKPAQEHTSAKIRRLVKGGLAHK